MTRIRNSIIVIVLIGATISMHLHVVDAEAAGTYRVLLINSYNYAYDIVPGQVEGLKNVFDQAGVSLDVDFMDTKAFPSDENYANYYEFLKYRIDNGQAYDAIIASDDNALDFLIDNKDTLVKGVPVVFVGINDADRIAKASALDNFYGLYEISSIKENLDFALMLKPEASEFLVLTDGTTTGIGDANTYLLHAGDYPDQTMTIVNLSDYTLEAFKDFLVHTRDDQILLYMTLIQDADGYMYTIDEAIDLLSDYSSQPVFRPTIGGVGEGLLGGFMKSYVRQGEITGEAVLSILNGTDIPEDSLFRESPNLYVVDYEVMEAYGLDVDVLPEGTDIINRPISLYEQYSHLLLPLILSVFVLILFVFVLMFDNYRRRKIELALRDKNIALRDLSEQLAASEEELKQQNDELIYSKEQIIASENRYRTLAYTDILTGLNNRMGLFRLLSHRIEEVGAKGALYFIDLDQFKYVNDSFGHVIGDRVLKTLGERFKAMEKEHVIANRLGGDEFVMVVFEEEGSKKYHKTDHFHRQIFEQVEDKILIEGQEFFMSCSIGIVRFPEHGLSVNELVRKADISLYKAKDGGRSRIAVYEDRMELDAFNYIGIQNNIRYAIEKNAFELFFQPQIDLNNKGICGFEALIRWRMEDGQLMSPYTFIPIAEQMGIIHRIGQWVLEEACRKAKVFIEDGFKDIKISVNVSSVELTRNHFAEEFVATIEKCGIDPKHIVMELTESILFDSTSEIHMKKFAYLRDRGVEIHLDDFGTGYSSLTYIQKIPMDVLKIDRGFIKDILNDDSQMQLTKSIIEIGHHLNLKVIAEGVEDEEQLSVLESMACDRIQGYYYAKPMPFDQALAYAKNFSH